MDLYWRIQISRCKLYQTYKDGVPNGKVDGQIRRKCLCWNFANFKRWNGNHEIKDQYKYSGEFKDSLFHGNGLMTWSSGEKYNGEFKNGEMNGQGNFSWPDGGTYVGIFK